MPLPQLVGREHESARLRDALDRAMAGRGGSVLVSGAAGIGKTTLVQSIVAVARDHGARVLTGACYDLSTTPPFGLWRDLFARAAPGEPVDSPFSALAGDAAWERAGDPGGLVRQVRQTLLGVSATTPIVLILEDLHWADAPSLGLLRDLTRHLDMVPVLLLATYRSDEIDRHHPLHPLIPVMVREGPTGRLDLHPFAPAELAQLVEYSYPGLRPEERIRLVDYLIHHAEGNALFATELLRNLEESGILQPQGEGWLLANLETAPLPSLLRQVIESRVNRLGESARHPLEIAAVIGQHIPLSIWSELARVPEDQLLDVIDLAAGANLLSVATDGTRVSFSHALVRLAIYESILPTRRRTWHRAAGEAIASGPGPDPDAVAHHFVQSGDPRAVDWLVLAGERAQRAYAQQVAGERFRAAEAALARHEPDSPQRGWLLYRAGRCLRFTNAHRANELLEQALTIAQDSRDALLQAYAAFDLGILRCFIGRMNAGLRQMESAIGRLDALPLDAARAAGRAAWIADSIIRGTPFRPREDDRKHDGLTAAATRLGNIALWYALAGQFESVDRVIVPYLDELDASVREDPLVAGAAADALSAAAYAAMERGQPEYALQSYEAALALYEVIDHLALESWMTTVVISHCLLPFYPAERARRDELLAKAGATLTRAETALPPNWQIDQNITPLLVFLGDWSRAERAAQAAYETGDPDIWLSGAAVLAELSRWRGESDPVRLLPADPARQQSDVDLAYRLSGAVLAMVVQAEVAMDAGDLDTARLWIEAHARRIATSGANRHRPATELLWSRFHLLSRDPGSAARSAQSALEFATNPDQPALQAAALRALADCEIAFGRWEKAAVPAQRSIDLYTACEAPFERARSEVVLARAFRMSGRDADAAALLAAARQAAAPLGAKRLLDQIEAIERELAAAPSTPRPLPGGLSTREVEVLRLVATGLTNAEVAAQLSISDRTVGQHLRSIFEKIDVSTRAAATRWAVEQKLT